MTKNLTWLAVGAAFVGMGISMPSCPGQQAMQQQIDTLQTKQSELTKSVQLLDSQLKNMNKDMTDVKTLLAQVSNTVLAQKQQLEQIDIALKAATAPKAAPRSAPRSAPPARRR